MCRWLYWKQRGKKAREKTGKEDKVMNREANGTKQDDLEDK